ncbi:MAG: hypothetical protein LBV16_01190 [Elusimicrobiota bacterium]|jgi:RecA-family ATPase|nr:hypothetical protein [Elusimicrobiota bacterium]
MKEKRRQRELKISDKNKCRLIFISNHLKNDAENKTTATATTNGFSQVAQKDKMATTMQGTQNDKTNAIAIAVVFV